MNKSSYSKNIYLLIVTFILLLAIYGRTLSVIFSNTLMENIDDLIFIIIFIILFLHILFIFRFPKAVLNKPLFFFLLVFIVSAIVNQVRIDIVIVQLRSYIICTSLYYLIVWSNLNNKQLIIIIKRIVIFSIPVFITAYLEFFLQKTILITTSRYGGELEQSEGFRVFTLIGNPIDFSNFAILLISIVMASVFAKYKVFNFKKYIFNIILLLSILTLFMSNSRGPVIALLLTFIFASVYLNIISKSKMILALGLLSISFLFIGDNFFQRITDFNFDVNTTKMYRVIYIHKSIEIIADNPVFGVGPGKFGGWVSINYHKSYIYELYKFSTDGISSIDMFFPHLIGELGILGFLIYLNLYFRHFVFFKNEIPKTSFRHNESKFISILPLLFISNLLIIGWFSIALETPLIMTLYFIVVGVCEKYIINHKLEN